MENNASKKYKKLMKKISWLKLFRKKEKAIALLLQEMKDEPYTIYEKSSGLIYLGLLYDSNKDYKKASEVFHQALLLVKEQPFTYSPNFKVILQTFEKAKMYDLKNYWQEDFSNRVQYDKKYLKLMK